MDENFFAVNRLTIFQTTMDNMLRMVFKESVVAYLRYIIIFSRRIVDRKKHAKDALETSKRKFNFDLYKRVFGK